MRRVEKMEKYQLLVKKKDANNCMKDVVQIQWIEVGMCILPRNISDSALCITV